MSLCLCLNHHYFFHYFFDCCNSNYSSRVKNNVKLLSKPEPGEWLAEHKEKGQSLIQYEIDKKASPNQNQNVIYLIPLGQFDSFQQAQIDLCQSYLSCFFQLTVQKSAPIEESCIPPSFRRIGQEKFEQLDAIYILDSVLTKIKHIDGIVYMALSQKDIYPSEDWNYVFGLATYDKHIGVTSLCRFNDFSSTSSASFDLALIRLLKTALHEIGHMFGLHHCVAAQCVMNGSNSLSELDKSSIRLCALCREKLVSNIKYQHEKRLADLIQFFKANNLQDSYQLLALEKKIKSSR